MFFPLTSMEFLFDPSLWVGLLTLVVLEIVLGIDNLVFVAILAKKLPVAQQDRALYTGLGLALVMRLGLLSIMSWLVSLTAPIFTVWGHPFSWRDLILLTGGVFLLFKATSELHERLEALPHTESQSRGTASFWMVIAQILLLDAVFSVDSIITAVGMVDNLGVMCTAVVIAMIVMVAASRPLTAFVNNHPTVVVLCLSFLLMIGLSLLAEGLGFHIPKGYLYAAIAFSILIEAFNQIATRNRVKHEMRLPFRERTTRAVLRLLEKKTEEPVSATEAMLPATAKPFAADEREMVEGVLSLADRSVRMIMTPRSEIGWLDLEKDFETLCTDVKDLHHSLFPVGEGSLDNLVGFVKAKDLIDCRDTASLRALAQKRRPFLVPETISLIRLVRDLRKNRATLVLVTDEFGVLQGLVTMHDILEAIAGEFPDEGEAPLLRKDEADGSWLADGSVDLVSLSHTLGGQGAFGKSSDFVTLAGLLLQRFGRLPQEGDAVEIEERIYEVVKLEKNRIALVRIRNKTTKDRRTEA